MNGPKRSYSTIKNSTGRCNGKLKDILSSSGHKSEEKIIEADLTNIPLIKQSENAKILPKYTTILAKLGDDGVSMDDLDQLQEDLEKLLSTSSVRIRYLLSEIGEIDRNDDTHERKQYHKNSLKRRRHEDKSKSKDLKNGMRVVKKNYNLPVNHYSHLHQEIPKVTLPKNDNSDKFWTSIEPYCTNVNKDDVAFLDSLIQEFSKEIDIKIPDVGEHYANTWTDEIINEEQNLGKSPSKKSCSNSDLKKNGLHAIIETSATSFTQRLLDTLPKNGDNGIIAKFKASDLITFKNSATNQKVGTCLDRRLKNELVELGILGMEDLNKNMPEDEILTEIKKCQQELATVNKYNIEELRKLKTVVCNDLHCNELKEQLENVDKQVLDLYNKIIMAKKSPQEESEDFDKTIAQADALLKKQIELNREINGLTDTQMLY